MRKIRHLEQCDYVIPIRQRVGQVLALSGQSNCYLERTWDKKIDSDFELKIQAKFNSLDIEGLNIEAGLYKNGTFYSSLISAIVLKRVADDNFTTTLVGSFAPTLNGVKWELNLDQSDLGLNELTGAETYLIEVEATRGRKKIKSFVYFNHLGVFDSIFRLRNQVTFLDLTKVDE